MIADFTLHRKGVYFEAGFAMARGIPVIFSCRSDELEQTHFDTRQYNHIVWETAKELNAKLSDRIRATVLR
jgi:nucleoside 2-deoxyribosyltransferase